MERETIRPPGVEYLYRCTGENDEQLTQHDHPVYGLRDKEAMDLRIADDWARCDCGSPIRRVYSFQHAKSMPEHYNLAAGQFVRTEKELNEVYHVKSEIASERLNLQHEFVPVSQSETSALNVTPQGLQATVERRDKLKMRVGDKVRKLAQDDG